MGSYNFTYKDVLKRYERIINKPSKFEIRLLACILLVITIVNITSLCFASEQNEPIIEVVEDCVMSQNSVLVNLSGYSTYFLTLEKGYYYDITLEYSGENLSDALRVGYTNSKEFGSTVYNYSRVGNYYHLVINSNDYNYFYFGFGNGYPTAQSLVNYTINKIEDTSMSGSVYSLVDNVGISQIWDIFDTSIGFVGVVVLVAFGIFLVVIAIRKIQKGKSEF